MSDPTYELVRWPDVTDPVLVLFLDGWIDAGIGGAGAMAHLLQEMDTSLVATFDVESLIDYRSRRPVMHLVEGVNTGLTWPSIELRHGVDAEGNDVLLLSGAEPDDEADAELRGKVDDVRGERPPAGVRLRAAEQEHVVALGVDPVPQLDARPREPGVHALHQVHHRAPGAVVDQ